MPVPRGETTLPQAFVATWCTHSTHGTTGSSPQLCNLCSCTNRPCMNIHSQFARGCPWDWAGRGSRIPAIGRGHPATCAGQIHSISGPFCPAPPAYAATAQDTAPPDRNPRASTSPCPTSMLCWGGESQAGLCLMLPFTSCYFFPLWGQGPNQRALPVCVWLS